MSLQAPGNVLNECLDSHPDSVLNVVISNEKIHTYPSCFTTYVVCVWGGIFHHHMISILLITVRQMCYVCIGLKLPLFITAILPDI